MSSKYPPPHDTEGQNIPNTLAHLGIQVVLTRTIMPKADIGWVWVAAVLPDIPWIAQRLSKLLPLGVSPFDIRLFAAVQSGFLITALAAAGLACFARRKAEALAILSLGSLLHLLLDAVQTKWANGVLLAAPFDWRLVNFGLFWPEDWPTYVLTATGFVIFTLMLRRGGPVPWRLRFPGISWTALAVLLLTAYIILPAILMPAARASNLHFVATLQDPQQRIGQVIEVDRAPLTSKDNDLAIRLWSGETFALEGAAIPSDHGDLSVKGIFITSDRILVKSFHTHPPAERDSFAILGLAMVLLWWGWGLLRGRRAACPIETVSR